jgi:plasmid stabilization system protein ParE
MKYTVVWTRAAEKRLAEIWLASANRQGVADAADAIDAYLKWLPITGGQLRDSLTRVLVARPLAVHYEVHDADRKVVVLMVRQIGFGGP